MGSDDLFKKRSKSKNLKRKHDQRIQKESLWIICEGETEESYFAYRFPRSFSYFQSNSIEKIKSKIEECKDATHIFVFLDNDIHDKRQIDGLGSHIRNKNATLIINSPCFEFWFILHFEKTARRFVGNGQGRTAGDECAGHLARIFKAKGMSYKKGKLDSKILQELGSRHQKAIENLQSIKNNLLYPDHTMLDFFSHPKI